MYTSILFKELMRYVLVRAISNTIFTHVTRGHWVSAALQDPPPPGTHCRWAQRRVSHSLIAPCCWGSGVFHADTLSLGSALLCTLIRQYSTLTHCHWARRHMTHSLSTHCHWAQCRITQSHCCWFGITLHSHLLHVVIGSAAYCKCHLQPHRVGVALHTHS